MTLPPSLGRDLYSHSLIPGWMKKWVNRGWIKQWTKVGGSMVVCWSPEVRARLEVGGTTAGRADIPPGRREMSPSKLPTLGGGNVHPSLQGFGEVARPNVQGVGEVTRSQPSKCC